MHAFSCTYCVTKHARLNYIIQLWIGILNEITSMFLTVVLAAIEMDHLHTYSSQFSSRYITKLPYGWTLLNHTLKTKAEGLGSFTKDVAGFLSAFKSWATWTKEIFRTCNVLPFSCTNLPHSQSKRSKVYAKQRFFFYLKLSLVINGWYHQNR